MSNELITHVLSLAASRRAKVLLVGGDSSLSYDAIIRIPNYRDNEEGKFIVKVKEDADRVSREAIVDLIVLSRVSNSTPIIVGINYGDEEMADGVAYKVHGIYAVGIRTFKRILDNEGGVKFVKDKGIVRASVKGQLLRRLREDRGGMSLGDLAKILGVTRRTVYEYERESIEASERTARILINIFNEDILNDVNLRPRDEEVINEVREREEMVDEDIKELLPSFRLYSLLKAHTKVAAHSQSESYLVEDKRRVSNEVFNVAKVLGVGLALIESDKRDVEFLESRN
ncbi:helix-turn-helix domain-containing protein [Vulcanisaeta distributa]|uniref:helix-turn-helix domain-containing protein n=1 Tax=Vulcanisaeta distributa TaxID=164451 RepID=UPI0006CF89AA|nr:helix-turn-helix domain-containing protein [Vulcanisaeta distributa]